MAALQVRQIGQIGQIWVQIGQIGQIGQIRELTGQIEQKIMLDIYQMYLRYVWQISLDTRHICLISDHIHIWPYSSERRGLFHYCLFLDHTNSITYFIKGITMK